MSYDKLLLILHQTDRILLCIKGKTVKQTDRQTETERDRDRERERERVREIRDLTEICHNNKLLLILICVYTINARGMIRCIRPIGFYFA